MSKFDPGVIQPGMEQIIESGDTLEITDENGQKFAVTATEGEATLNFIKAFDLWYSMTKSEAQGPVVAMAWKGVQSTFDFLPLRVQRQLPSFKSLGVSSGIQQRK